MKKTSKSKAASQPEVILHGEAMLFRSELPKDAAPINPSNMNYHIIADSETTGNHHVVDFHEGVQFFQTPTGTTFMINEGDTAVRCLHPDRHSPITLQPGCWEFGIQQEYDHFEQNMRAVKD